MNNPIFNPTFVEIEKLGKSAASSYARTEWNREDYYGVATAISKLSSAVTHCGDIKLSEYIELLKGDNIHRCPNCGGTGYLLETYDAYPSGLPDSGWAHDYQQRKKTCDLCKGDGWTKKKYVERTKIVSDGFYPVEE